ncbi:hypothetical protein ACHAXR_012138 [Thalassiosira sp. AJA248-18]
MESPRSASGWLRKRPLNQSTESFHILQQHQSFHQSEEEHYSPTTPSKSLDREHSSRPQQLHHQTPLHALMPTLCNGYDNNSNDDPPPSHGTNNYSYHGERSSSTMILCLFIISVYSSSYVYFVKMPIWSYEEEWTRWEEGMQRSVADLIPPLPSDNDNAQAQRIHDCWRSNSPQLEQFPYLKQKVSHRQVGIEAASEYAVPIPDYELMGRTRGKLAQKLQRHAINSCQKQKNHAQQHHANNEKHSLPVIGITVANDTPDNRYLRRLLHTIDLTTVGSIVVTWYDEQTEAQLLGMERVGLSHEVIEQALQEFISRRGFTKISWGNATIIDGDEKDTHVRLADTTSLELMSQIATSVQQFCMYDDNESKGYNREKAAAKRSSPKPKCQNELLVLQFPTNLGCSSGVNNALFTHPTAPHWLITNYDIAYPSGVLSTMGKELQKTKKRMPDLAVHTYGYIYGRGKLENPWSNFVMTSCAVANVGIWDENIFPAYYEDDDYRDRIRYVMGKWMDVIGDPELHGDAPQHLMNDTHLIRYQMDRNVSVAHGPLTADTYLSGTHETMKKVDDEENEEHSLLESIWLWLHPNPPNPFHYENQRWSIMKEVSNAEGYFQCKHGALPDAGEHGEDSLRYFGWHERFLLPFVNRTRVTRLQESMSLNETVGKASVDIRDVTRNPSSWALWTFNSTRRNCVHKATNLILSLPPSDERTNLTQKFKALCSVC